MSKNEQEFIQVLNTFQPLGAVRAGELLLTDPLALKFLDQLERLEIDISGINGWFKVSSDVYMEDSSALLDMADVTSHLPDANGSSYDLARRFIKDYLPDRVTHVSFVLDTDVRLQDNYKHE